MLDEPEVSPAISLKRHDIFRKAELIALGVFFISFIGKLISWPYAKPIGQLAFGIFAISSFLTFYRLAGLENALGKKLYHYLAIAGIGSSLVFITIVYEFPLYCLWPMSVAGLLICAITSILIYTSPKPGNEKLMEIRTSFLIGDVVLALLAAFIVFGLILELIRQKGIA